MNKRIIETMRQPIEQRKHINNNIHLKTLAQERN